jgi:hypothetical protein
MSVKSSNQRHKATTEKIKGTKRNTKRNSPLRVASVEMARGTPKQRRYDRRRRPIEAHQTATGSSCGDDKKDVNKQV